MSDPIQIIGDAMRAEAEALRIVSVNVANAETTAYRRQVPVVQAAQVQFEQLLGNVTEQAAALAAQPIGVALDLRPGTLKSTSEPFHLALDGPGFLVLQSESSGQDLLLTRRGDLHVSADGDLVSATGALVLGNKGTIHIGSATPVISADGSVRIDNQLVDELRIVNVTEPTRLQPLGDGTYRAESGAITEGERSASVRQGFLETSNVTPTNEVVQLMETVRRFEAEQRFALAYSGMQEKAISELGKVN